MASIRELHQQLVNKERSALEVTRETLARIEAVEPRLHSFLYIMTQQAEAAATRVDEKIAAGESIGLLEGIPIGIKDNMCISGIPTTCGSRILENFVPPYESTVTQKLKAAGAVLVGKTNLDEFAMGSSTENSAYALTSNPWDLSRVPGGSSGGSAAAVAAEECVAALGSDTGGSIRQPASFCGVVGVKPTYGLVSRFGLVAFASSLDQIGPFGRSVEDAATLLSAIAGHDPADSTSLNLDIPDYTQYLTPDLPNHPKLKIGVITETFGEGLSEEVKTAVQGAINQLEAIGADVVEISCPRFRYGLPAYYIIAPSEASSNLARYDAVRYGKRSEEADNLLAMYTKTRAEGFGEEVKRRIMVGTYTLSAGYYDAYYLKALKVRRLIYNDYEQAFQKVDVIASPVAPTPAFKIGELIDDPLAMYLTDIYTLGANMAGLPGISVPAGLSQDGLPIGLQLLAPAFAEEAMLRAARMFESAANWRENKLN